MNFQNPTEPREQVLSNTEISKMTPMMQQYFKLKAQTLNSILFFRMGDFYEVFAQDAEEIAPKLELVLTSRERGDQQRVKFCGVPHHSARSYWLKLLKLGYRVAIADQVEDAAEAKGLVKRAIYLPDNIGQSRKCFLSIWAWVSLTRCTS